MPIVNAFDFPQGGANGGFTPGDSGGGGGGGGAALQALVPDVIDLTDGTWTLEDPDGLIDTSFGTNGVTFDSNTGVNKVRFNAATQTSLGMYCWINSNGGHHAPRWYKLLKINGVQMTASDIIVQRTTLDWDGVSDDFQQGHVLGLCQDPTSTVADTIAGAGSVFLKNDSGSSSLRRESYGAWSHDASSNSTASDQVNGYAITQRGPTYSGGHVLYQAFDINGEQRASGARVGHGNLSLSGNVYVMFGFGVRTTSASISAGDETGLKATTIFYGVG